MFFDLPEQNLNPKVLHDELKQIGNNILEKLLEIDRVISSLT